MSLKDVHTEHCCILHGCKYGNKNCTVTTGKAQQSYACESCDSERDADIAIYLVEADDRFYTFTPEFKDKAVELAKAVGTVVKLLSAVGSIVPK